MNKENVYFYNERGVNTIICNIIIYNLLTVLSGMYDLIKIIC